MNVAQWEKDDQSVIYQKSIEERFYDRKLIYLYFF